MCVLIGNSGTVSKVSKCLTALGSTEKNSVGSSGCTKCELIKGEAFSSSSSDALACILGEGKSTDGHGGYFHHTNIVGFEHFFEDAENVYIILELCQSASLSELLRRRKRLHELEVQCYTV